MDSKVIKKTQDTLGKIIKKPPLSDKLLSKPPFRFLHDLCTTVIKTTGFMKGLFTDSEMNSENVKDRESKLSFLQKAIDLTSLVNGKTVAAKPSKIVAGHEPEQTNEWLQSLAEAINKKVDNDDYVKRVLTGDTSAPAPPAEKPSSQENKPEKKDRERSADRRKRDDERDKKPRDRKEGSRDREGSAHRKEKESRDKENKDKDRREKSKRDDDRKDRHREKEDRHKDDKSRDKDRRRPRDEEDENKENKVEMTTTPTGEGDMESKEEEAPTRMIRPTSAKGSRRRQTQDRSRTKDKVEEPQKNDESPKESPKLNGHVEDETSTPQNAPRARMARPSSARPAPPRVKQNDPPPEEPTIVGPSNVPNIITDKQDDSSDDDDIFVTKDDEEAPAPPPEIMSQQQKDDDDDGGEHGGLVKKMMEAKEKLEGGSHAPNQQPKKVEIERSSQVSDASKRKEREMVRKEIEKLRGSIQTLTRSVNPLGKILDFVQEDLDSMQKELEMWKLENSQNQVALQREQSITESSIEPLRAHLTEIDNAIRDQVDLIAAVKSNVLKNDEKITKMLGSITKS